MVISKNSRESNKKSLEIKSPRTEPDFKDALRKQKRSEIPVKNF